MSERVLHAGLKYTVVFHRGSVIVPLLFLFFVNGLPKWIKNSINMFDDTKIWAMVKDLPDTTSLQQHWEPGQKSRHCSLT